MNLGAAQASGSEIANDLNNAKVAAMKAAELGKHHFSIFTDLFCDLFDYFSFND